MMFSLNEIAATAKKATRGAGYPWGVADEAGFAVKWLTSLGVDGCAALASLLVLVDGLDLKMVNPRSDALAPSGPFVCPILAGCMMSDFGPGTYRFAAVASPVLLLPFVSVWGGATIKSGSGRVITDGSVVGVEGHLDGIASDVSVTPKSDDMVACDPTNRADPDLASWNVLMAFAHRTYAPATAESRLKGAG